MGKIDAEANSMVTVNLLTIIFPMNLQYLYECSLKEVTFLVPRSEYPGTVRSIPKLLMPWLLVLPHHQAS